MLERIAKHQLVSLLSAYPAVALIGPRQCGKTTLARSLGGRFFDLENETDIVRLEAQWDEIAASKELIVFDEAQNWPPLFNRLRVAIDADRARPRRFLVTSRSAVAVSAVFRPKSHRGFEHFYDPSAVKAPSVAPSSPLL